MKDKIYFELIRFVALICLLLVTNIAFGQSCPSNVPFSCSLGGPITVYLDEDVIVSGSCPRAYDSYIWDNGAGSTVISSSNSWVTQYHTPGVRCITLEANCSGFPKCNGSEYTGTSYLQVTVLNQTAPPPSPDTEIYVVEDCGSTTVFTTSGATPPYEYWWQTEPNGQSTALGKAGSITRYSPGSLFLQTRHSVSGTWGGYINAGNPPGSYVYVDATPKPGDPYNPQSGVRFGSGPITLSATTGSNSDNLRWYNDQYSPALFDALSKVENVNAPGSRTYYIKSLNSLRGCVSVGYTTVTATAYALPQITPNPAFVGGTLSVGGGYDSYQWQKPDGQIVTNVTSIVANIPGNYNLTVTKSGLSASTNALVKCGDERKIAGVVQGCSIIVRDADDNPRTTFCQGELVKFSPGSCSPSGGFSSFAWSDNAGHDASGFEFTTGYSPGIYCMRLESICDGAPNGTCGTTERSEFTYVAITVEAPLPSIQTTVSPRNVECQNFNAFLTVTNPVSGQEYSWFKQGDGGTDTYVGTGNPLQVFVNDFAGYYVRYGAQYSGPACTGEAYLTVSVSKTLSTPVVLSNSYRKAILKADPGIGVEYWQQNTGDQSFSDPTSSNKTVFSNGDYFIRGYNSTINCWTAATGIHFTTLNVQPPLAQAAVVKGSGSNEIYFLNPDKNFILQHADYYWVNGTGGTQGKKFVHGAKVFFTGMQYLRGKDRETGTWGPALTINLPVRGDEGYNWILTKSFDGSSNEFIVAESKSYFDEVGRMLQSQSKNLERNYVFTSENLYDKFNRVVGSTLPAPILAKDFGYNEAFNLGTDGQSYNHTQFDYVNPANPADNTRYNPSPVSDQEEGTVGWYYSANNTIESGTPATQYPFSRVLFYEDGSGETLLSGGAGEQLRIGGSHETRSGSFPVANELDEYLAIRKTTVFQNALPMPATLLHEAVQQVARDENGRYAISFNNKEGKTVMTARPGNWLAVNNSVTSGSLIYFYLLQPEPVSISGGGSYTVTDLVTNQPFTSPGATWPEGFYRITVTSGSVTTNYSNHYADIAYNFYDDAGRLVSSITPNGYQQLKMNSPLVPYADIDKTTYNYNHRGWLLSMKETDAGITNYMYRKDGSIRFSQNAVQSGKSRFSYTHYDALGRPIESGEYKGTAEVFNSAALKAKLEITQQQIWTGTDITDWVKTYYDKPNTALATAGLPATYVQTFVRGAVASTENANIQTWYSYDELGRVKWMAQKPKILPRVFVVEYAYDFLGNVLTVGQKSFQAGALKDQFYHYYTYDKDKRLTLCHTSTDGNESNKTLQAKYLYYLHGPLKRIELAAQLQGIDFVYNIQGWLQSINHPDTNRDPGLDGAGGEHAGFRKDAFGLQLQYYENSIAPLQVSVPDQFDPIRFHKLPELETQVASSLAKNDVRKNNLRELQTSLMALKKQYTVSNPNSND